jgi:alkanesulfonate monooxygenase SsuD/methylene tetrahydromethanopterin reductase-like flavin-dependent oxidoreductase (luciferase family)
MHFSVFLTTRSMGPAEDEAILDATIAHAQRAEELGFDAIFSPDHHFTGYAPWASDPFVFQAYLAAILKKVYFGFSVTTIPLYHPVRFAERLNLLDQLTKGRLLVGIGSGTPPEESIGFGVNFKETSRVAQENIDLVLKLWGKQLDDELIQFDTGTYKGALVQRLVPAPYTKPFPRIMPVAFRDTSIALAAEHGWPAFVHAFTPPHTGNTEPLKHFTAHFTKYRDALAAAGHPAEVVADALSWTTRTYQFIHVAPTDEQARAELNVILTGYKTALDREHVYNKRAEQLNGVQVREHPDPFSEEWQRPWCLVGSPDTVAAELRQYADLGVGNILGSFTHGLLTPERWKLTNQAMQLFAEEVMPRFKG